MESARCFPSLPSVHDCRLSTLDQAVLLIPVVFMHTALGNNLLESGCLDSARAIGMPGLQKGETACDVSESQGCYLANILVLLKRRRSVRRNADRVSRFSTHASELRMPPRMLMEASPSPLSSRANPDFLPRSTRQGHVCAFQ
jgi:hypothetical protein